MLLYPLDILFTRGAIILDILMITMFTFSIFTGKVIPNSFQSIINNAQEIFQEEDKYKAYANFIFGTKNPENNKEGMSRKINFQNLPHVIEKYIPIIVAPIIPLMGLSFMLQLGFAAGNVGGYVVNFDTPEKFMLNLINFFASIVQSFIFMLLLCSTLLILLASFICVHQIGTDEYKIDVSYEHLKRGLFQEIGVFIISFSIPVIILSTFFSAFGYYLILALPWDRVPGVSYLILGVLLNISIIFLLYRNTLTIHEKIIEYKEALKKRVMQDIQDAIPTYKNREFSKDKLIYSEMQEMHEFYSEVSSIQDWPFNPTSIKKLLITLASSIVPIILSIFGLGG